MHSIHQVDRAKSVVSGWFKKSKQQGQEALDAVGVPAAGDDPASDSTTLPAQRWTKGDELKARPQRLGVGAKFLPHNQAIKSLDLKVAAGAKKKKRKAGADEEEARARAAEEDSDEEGKSSTFKNIPVRKKQKGTKKAKDKEKGATAAATTTTTTSAKPKGLPGGVDDVGKVVAADFDTDFVRLDGKAGGQPKRTPKGKAKASAGGAAAAGGQGPKKKRKKVRSKQKNIRKDRRPDSEKPSYLHIGREGQPNRDKYQPHWYHNRGKASKSGQGEGNEK